LPIRLPILSKPPQSWMAAWAESETRNARTDSRIGFIGFPLTRGAPFYPANNAKNKRQATELRPPSHRSQLLRPSALADLPKPLKRHSLKRGVAWARETYARMEPFTAPARYVNYLGDDETGDPVAAAYGPNYQRLQTLKRKYDPENFFRMNQNIQPLG
jgi:Berberine and berberine like